MASLIEGFEYDIFISYRQKDNKHDGWVTEFVNNLKAELESTFKDEISVYFDINPHDGLLETHDVDATLKEKLRCLIFIPVISRTYCDPKSFAWEHEFKAFATQASTDKFGLKVTLRSGNVTSRILPVRIHELDSEDKELLETVTCGVLRAIDFVYKEPGVNRPLTPADDEHKNQYGTKYRNQVNKTANAVKDIISALRSEPLTEHKEKHPLKEEWEGSDSPALEKSQSKNKASLRKQRIVTFFTILLALFAIIYSIVKYSGNFSVTGENRVKSIAVLPFESIGVKPEYTWLGDALTDEIISQLNKIGELDVRSRTSVMRYKYVPKSISQIGKEVNANFIIEGSFQENEDRFRINVKLINSKKDRQLWGEIYEGTWSDMSAIQAEIAERTASTLRTVLSPEEKARIEKKPTRNPGAYMSYLSGNVQSQDAMYFFLTGDKFMDSINFMSAINMYDRAVRDDPSFALAYARRSMARSWGYHVGQLDTSNVAKCKADADRAFEIDGELPEAQIALGFYYFYCTDDYQAAISCFKNAEEMDPANYQPTFYMAMVYRKVSDWKRSQELIMKVIQRDPQDAVILLNIGHSFNYLHSYDTALSFYRKASEVMPAWTGPYSSMIDCLILKYGNTVEARKVLDTSFVRTGKKQQALSSLLSVYEGKYKQALAEVQASSDADFESPGLRYLTLGWIYNLLNDKKMTKIFNDSALVLYKKIVMENPENCYAYSFCGLAYAGSGNFTDAVIAGKTAVELSGNDGLVKSDMIMNLAKIYLMNDDLTNAFRQAEYLLNNPSGFSPNLVKVDPDWKKLAELPDFKKLAGKFEENYKQKNH